MTAPELDVHCAECDFLIAPGDPRVLTDFGWTHPLCATETP